MNIGQRASTASLNNPYTMSESVLKIRQTRLNVGRICTQLYSALLAVISALSFGTVLGWSSPVLSKLLDDYEMTASQISWIASIMPLGSSIGIAIAFYSMEKIGPRRTTLLQGPFYILTWIFMSIFTNFPVYMAGRFFQGLLGISLVTCSERLLYDTVHYKLLRYLSAVFHSSVYFGVLITHSLSLELSKYITIFCGCVPIVHFLLLLTVPESPVYLYKKSELAAEKSLAWYRGVTNIYMDMRSIRNNYDVRRVDPETYQYMMFSKVVVKGILIVLGVTFFQVYSGYGIFIFYNIHVWHEIDHIENPIIDSTTIVLVLYLSNLLWGIVHSFVSFNIRKLLIASNLLVAIQLTGLATYLSLRYYWDDLPYNSHWIPLGFGVLQIFFCDMSLNYCTKVLIYDYMPIQVLKRAQCLTITLHWFLLFILIKSIESFKQTIPPYIVFIILASLMYLGTLYCYIFVVETKGKSLVQIQMAIGGNPIGTRVAGGRAIERTSI